MRFLGFQNLKTQRTSVSMRNLLLLLLRWFGCTAVQHSERTSAWGASQFHPSRRCSLRFCANFWCNNVIVVAEIIEDTDDNLFLQVLYNNSHVLNSLLPSTNKPTRSINHILFANMKNYINNFVNVSTHVAGYQKSCRVHKAGHLL